jgi:delta-1-pyrroline-5-carboxylate synthetase
VDGLYDGPPSDPQSKIIHTYNKEEHHSEITFGDMSRVGRGGMTAKLKAALQPVAHLLSLQGNGAFASQQMVMTVHDINNIDFSPSFS